MNGTALAVITLSLPPSGAAYGHSGSLSLWTGKGSSSVQSTLKLELLGGEDHGNASVMVAELAKVGRSEAHFLAGQLAGAFGEVNLRESPVNSGPYGCCTVC